MIHTGGIPLDCIGRLEIYQNTRRETMLGVWNRMQPDFLFNGPFFSWNMFSATCHMKIHGKVICDTKTKAEPDGYREWGFAWNDGEAPQWRLLPCEKDNYFTNTVLVVDGEKRDKPIWHADADGTPQKPRYTSRPAFGFKDTRFMYNINTGGVSLPGMQNTMYSAGWCQGVMGDGGGSTMGKCRSWEIYSGRIIPYFILIFLKDNELKGEKPMVEINAYSKKKDGGKKLSSNFTVKEFACSDGTDTVFVAPRLVMVLQSIRSHFGKAVTISSAYRTPVKNAAVGGVEDSQHCYGTAADISVKGMTPRQVADYAESIMPDWGGIGIYDNPKSGHFTHIDVREVKARWKG